MHEDPLNLTHAERRVLEAMQAITRHLAATAEMDDVILQMQAKKELHELQERLLVERQYYELIFELTSFAELATDKSSIVYH